VNLLTYLSDVEVVGVADESDRFMGEIIGQSSITMTFEDLPSCLDRGVQWAALAIGDNDRRAEMFTGLTKAGFQILSAAHPKAMIERDVHLGIGTMVCAGAILSTQVRIGENVLINTGAIIDHESVIGSHAHIAPGCSLAGRVRVGEKAFVGIGTSVRHGVTIGARAVIGAGSVVVDDIPDGAVAYGVPAKVQRNAEGSLS
jgi:UDP-N-acetylbacillosamine N-acetyltransferase